MTQETQPAIAFSQSSQVVEAYDFVEVTLNIQNPTAANPFTDAAVFGQFQREDEPAIRVDGFCDSEDGSSYRIRFMPVQEGQYNYSVTYQHNATEETYRGTFQAQHSQRLGLLRVDKDYPWHFVWEGTGEHYFWNGTTTYSLMGWDEDTIRQSIDRLHKLKVNRLRVVLTGRVENGQAWAEPVYPTDKFTFLLNPWVTERPDSVENPGFDVTRFNVAYWQKYERLLHYARERDMIISVIFYLDGARPGVDPFGKERMGGEDEQRYYRYAAARLSAYSNVLWDVTNEYHLFRDDAWVEQMGNFLKSCDPYNHLMSVHGFGEFHFRTSTWADFAMYQSWDEHGGYAFMLKNRELQAQTGRIIPQVNEEYGYEDHYPEWGGNRKAPARSADNRRRLAWEMSMASSYQTTGERADTGTGWGPDTGGGWINGRGDDSMIMLHGYACILEFFTQLEWWKLEPHNDLVNNDALCLAEPGTQYVVYLPAGGNVTLSLEPGSYRASWYNPRSGKTTTLERVQETNWTSPSAPDQEDWTLLLQKQV